MRPVLPSGAILSLALVAAPLVGQGAPPAAAPLAPPDATLPLELTRVAGVRELADGRLLILDAGDSRLWVADLARGAAAEIGRRGAGPGEYEGPSALWPLAADSTLLVDRRLRRWLLLRTAAIVATVAAESPAIRGGAALPLGADLAGHVLTSRPLRPPGPAGANGLQADSLWLVRVDRATGRQDTLTAAKARPAHITVTGPRDHPTSVNIVMNPLAVGEEAVLFPDGWVAVARLAPFRVEWLPPHGRPIVGGSLPDERRPVDEAEKRFLVQRAADRTGTPARSPEEFPDWPARVPPFTVGALLAAADGSLWIRRPPSPVHPETAYDVIDRRGALARRIVMSDREEVVGVGRRGIYTVSTDDDGVEHLRRHPLVPSPQR